MRSARRAACHVAEGVVALRVAGLEAGRGLCVGNEGREEVYGIFDTPGSSVGSRACEESLMPGAAPLSASQTSHSSSRSKSWSVTSRFILMRSNSFTKTSSVIPSSVIAMASVHLLFGEVGAAKLGFSPPTIDDVEPRPWYDDGGGREVSSGSRENFARLGQVALGDGIFFYNSTLD